MAELAVYARQPSALYAAGVARGHLLPNVAQQHALQALDTLAEKLPRFEQRMREYGRLLKVHRASRKRAVSREYQLLSRESLPTRLLRTAWQTISGQRHSPDELPDTYYRLPKVERPPCPPQGMYVYGDVGTGKSLLVDMLYSCAAPRLSFARRMHYHSFMLSVYEGIHRYDGMSDRDRREVGFEHPLDSVVSMQLGFESVPVPGAGLLCFDEFQISDVADARLMHGVMTRLMSQGIVICFTSNRPASDLNKSILRDADFQPFLELLEDRCQTLPLSSGMDFRNVLSVKDSTDRQYYFGRNTPDSVLRERWREEACCEWDETVSRSLHVSYNRLFHVHYASPSLKAVQLTTEELLEAPVGACDFRAIAEKARVIFITDKVPQFSMAKRNLVRRFITLVDVCYEHKTRLVMRMDCDDINDLFGTDLEQQPLDVVGIAESMQFETEVARKGVGAQNRTDLSSALYTGEDEAFAFRRAISRLREMATRNFEKRSPYFW